ncbi:putative ArsR family transcriptional regulator [Asanoa ferruginea]|uniref:Putative ArsR family transcriptional regulator n=1 Tax=Asanoa ferruginea TaxID=53367 RepID=A0A3D9ZEI0_9ACTN|nr:transcriptional regulator [Asanoa ferruginea]REF95701.1 putative ArsR family transcriptional regulator [Asanoa ferruginea]GIF51788.1 transcriptional regulator [Asanoa ferruginea]
MTAPGSPVEALAVLADEQRRRMFGFIRRARRPVTREEVAAHAGTSTKLAAFHLDKLVAAGLLCAREESPGGVRKVGRKPKVYEPADADLQVSIPERRPDVIAEILLDAVLSHAPGDDGQAAALRAARVRGEQLGAGERARLRPGRLGPERSLTLTEALLERRGFEPVRTAPTEIRLLNCPFHALASRSPELVCGINHAYLGGLLAGLETNGVDAALAPRPGHCCVELRTDGGHSPTDAQACAKD